MKVAVTTPLYISNDEIYQYALDSVESYVNEGVYKIAIINKLDEKYNGILDYFDKHIYNTKNIVARAWNRGIDLSINEGCEYTLVINQDVNLTQGDLANLVENAYRDGSIVSGKADERNEEEIDYCCFLVKNNLFDIAGRFDENFIPAYFEDSDMKYRLKLIGARCNTYEMNYTHGRSSTTRLDSNLRDIVNYAFNRCEKYYERKWGGSKWNETYTTPFNDPKLTIKDW